MEKLIIFDIDDTITASISQHLEAFVHAMQTIGVKNIDQNWKDYKHHTDSHILQQNFNKNKNEIFDFSIIPSFETIMTNKFLNLEPSREVKGALMMLNKIIDSNEYAIAFATGSLLQPALIKLRQANIPFTESLVVGANYIFERESIVNSAIEHAKKHYNKSHFQQIISVGDGIWDYNTAQNLGLDFIGVGMKNYDAFKAKSIKAHVPDWSNFDLSLLKRQLSID